MEQSQRAHMAAGSMAISLAISDLYGWKLEGHMGGYSRPIGVVIRGDIWGSFRVY